MILLCAIAQLKWIWLDMEKFGYGKRVRDRRVGEVTPTTLERNSLIDGYGEVDNGLVLAMCVYVFLGGVVCIIVWIILRC